MPKYNATRTLSVAIPTVRLEDNLVKKWDLKVVYTYNGFTRDYGESVDVLYLAKSAAAYTKSELMSLLNLVQYDQIFDAHYDAYHAPVLEEKVADFDITKMAD
jgi:hypothetical protein